MQHCWGSNYGASFVVKVKPKADKYYKRFQTLSFAMVMLAFLLLKIKHLFETGPGTGETHPKATFIYSTPPACGRPRPVLTSVAHWMHWKPRAGL